MGRPLLVCCSLVLSVLLLACAGKVGGPTSASLHQELDVVYGKGGEEDLKLDLYAPRALTSPAPALVLIHGGGWSGGSRDAFRDAARRYAALGYVAVTVDYRLAPRHKWPAQIEDVKCAVRWLRANADTYHVDPDRICALGASAGGHLALLLGFTDARDGLEGTGGHPEQSSKVQAVVNLFGPTDVTQDEWPAAVEKMFVDVLGASRARAPELYRQFSPITHIREGSPPVLTFHGTKDPLVPYEQATRLDRALRQAGVVSQLETIEGKGHGDWPPAVYARALKTTTEFLDRHLNEK